MRTSKHEPVVEEYSRTAQSYDTRWSFYIDATTRETLARINLSRADCVLDVGCGTGALLERIVHEYPDARLAGVDPVPEMLALARRKLPPEAELKEGWAEGLPWGDACFDVVISSNMFHFIRQPLIALREMQRVLRTGGQIIITDWCDDYLACRINDWYLRLRDAAHVKTYTKRECTNLLQEAGCANATVERYKISLLWGLMTAKATT
jgi:ubiquinone/menaquinone biosynthesis C-methylase UbiE